MESRLKREKKMLRSTAVRKGGGVDLRERKILRSTAVLAGGGVDSRERTKCSDQLQSSRVEVSTQKIEQIAEINCSTYGWRCRLKRENKSLRSTAVLTGGGVDSRDREREREIEREREREREGYI